MTEPREKSAPREPIRIVDRRKFTPEGVPRTPDQASEEILLPPPGNMPPAHAAGQDRATGPDNPAARDDQAGPGSGDNPLASTQFKNLVLGLGNQAATVLREIASSSGPGTEIGLEGAHQMIDILEALRVKTRGNLTPEEATLLDDLIYDLQMEFVALQGRPPRDT